MKKKWFVYLLVICLAVSVIGCGEIPDADKDALATTEESSEDSEKADSTEESGEGAGESSDECGRGGAELGG